MQFGILGPLEVRSPAGEVIPVGGARPRALLVMLLLDAGRMVAVGGPKAPTFFVFASEQLDYDRDDPEQHRRVLADAYRGAGWRLPEIIARLPRARDLYLDSISRVEIDEYARGRVVLLGDAAYGNTLGGFGTGLAVVGAYVLALKDYPALVRQRGGPPSRPATVTRPLS
ncbi:hypothetical protein Misp01_78740 [Microtetraspora sp. NBRC 13810]|uniref:hypothetical protein n=1 Tax=Microtetraspora sp. NBRC 13810 TaxID=3030990 RepID=UPI0024A5D034|nr:hypothetical protein [Microtetraspora sp. NBRC 13810]GLW12746.1 hypothetical protein Misp01_78740 [Microtetraspora sp. NBRC 13810]